MRPNPGLTRARFGLDATRRAADKLRPDDRPHRLLWCALSSPILLYVAAVLVLVRAALWIWGAVRSEFWTGGGEPEPERPETKVEPEAQRGSAEGRAVQRGHPTAEGVIFALILGAFGYVAVVVWAAGNPPLAEGAGLIGLVGAAVGGGIGGYLGDRIAAWDRSRSDGRRRR